VEIISMFKGNNNGALWLSVRDAADRMGVSDTKTASRAFLDLETVGFIDMTKDAFFKVKA
jgi:DNA-binding transcriptional regulator YhcF (GntR family)